MNKKNVLALLVAAASVVGACSSKVYTKTSGSANLVQHKTYQWVDVQPNENEKRNPEFIDMELAIRDVTNQTLLSKGYTLVNEGADLLLNYDAMVDRTTVETADAAYLQTYNPGFYHPYTKAWKPITFPSGLVGWDGNLSQVMNATFVLTINQVNTNIQVWQGWTKLSIGDNGLQPDEAREAVEDILRKLKPIK